MFLFLELLQYRICDANSLVFQENSYWLNATAMEYMFSNWKVGSLLNSPFSGGIVDGTWAAAPSEEQITLMAANRKERL